MERAAHAPGFAFEVERMRLARRVGKARDNGIQFRPVVVERADAVEIGCGDDVAVDPSLGHFGLQRRGILALDRGQRRRHGQRGGDGK